MRANTIPYIDDIDHAYLSHIKKGKRNPMYGKHVSDKAKAILSLKKKGIPNYAIRGKNNTQWAGGKSITSDGYVLIKDWSHPRRHYNGYVYEHVVILEKKIGRPLTSDEVSHHINGNKSDNRPENLEVMKRRKHISQHHTNARFVEHSNTICSICGRANTKMNKKRDGTPYPLWLYVEGHKHDKDYAMCQTCWTRYNRQRKKEVSYPE